MALGQFLGSALSAGSGLALKGLIGSTPLGMAASALAPGLFQGLTDALGISSGGSSSSRAGDAIGDLAKIQHIASYNAAGYEGADANRSAQSKAAELLGNNSAESLLNQNMQKGLASQALQSAQNQSSANTALAQQQMGDLRQQALKQAALGGGGAAALAGIAQGIGKSSSQALSGLAAQNAQSTAQALQAASGFSNAADQARMQDIANRIATFEAYGLKKFSPTNAGGVASMGDFMQTEGQINAIEDPNALLKAIGGQISGMETTNMNTEMNLDKLLEIAHGRRN